MPHENFDASKWKTIVDHLQNISDSKKKIYLAQTSTRIDESTTDGELQKLALYAFASFLLGKGDYAYFAFHAVPSDTYDYFYFDYWGTDIGEPLEYYHLRGDNIYEREFENVLVLVNPGESSSTVNLGAQFRTLTGSIVSSITLEPKSGIILYKTAAQTTTTTSVRPTTTTSVRPSTTTSVMSTTTTTSVVDNVAADDQHDLANSEYNDISVAHHNRSAHDYNIGSSEYNVHPYQPPQQFRQQLQHQWYQPARPR